MGFLFGLILSLLAVFLILLVLVQRGRGGGLSGAFGGMGGSSAFGAKAGDVFTRITIVAASVWILVCVMAAYWAGNRGDLLGEGAGSTLSSEDILPPGDADDEAAEPPASGPALSPPENSQSDEQSPSE